MKDLIYAIRSETRKVLTLRSSLVFAIVLTGSIYGPIFLVGLAEDQTRPVDWGTLLIGGSIFNLLGLIFAAASTGAQLSSGMQANAFLTQTRRSLWLIARLIVVVVFLVVTFLIGAILSLVVAAIMPKLEFDLGSPAGIFVNFIVFIGLGLLGAGLAVVFNSRVLAIALPFVWMYVVENLVTVAAFSIPGLERMPEWLLGKAIGDVYQGIDPGHASLVIALWAAVAIIGGFIMNQRRDVK